MMTTLAWLSWHALTATFWLWILCWGGARVVEGWTSFWLIHWMAPSWNAEQIRLYALCILVFQAIWFLIGLFKPELRLFI